MNVESGRKPAWIRTRLRSGARLRHVDGVLREFGLHTVCEEANCPNRMECYSNSTATFLILGAVCTRTCTFCDVRAGHPQSPSADEPEAVAEAAFRLKLRHVVVTSVTRDDLPDGGASHFALTVSALRARLPGATVEVLIPDFRGDEAALAVVLRAAPDILNHNVETVPRLYPDVRPQADYRRSIELLRRAAAAGLRTKSGIMLGLGEEEAEVEAVVRDLLDVGCALLTLGQYLAPSALHHPVVEWVSPPRFAALREWALAAGFQAVAAGPLVRSSYHAAEMMGDVGARGDCRR